MPPEPRADLGPDRQIGTHRRDRVARLDRDRQAPDTFHIRPGREEPSCQAPKGSGRSIGGRIRIAAPIAPAEIHLVADRADRARVKSSLRAFASAWIASASIKAGDP